MDMWGLSSAGMYVPWLIIDMAELVMLPATAAVHMSLASRNPFLNVRLSNWKYMHTCTWERGFRDLALIFLFKIYNVLDLCSLITKTIYKNCIKYEKYKNSTNKKIKSSHNFTTKR